MLTENAIARRSAIAVSLTIIAAAAVFAARTPVLDATPAASTAAIVPTNHWLDGLKGKHRQFFDTPAPNGGVSLVHILNYYDTYNKAFGVKDADIDAVLTFYGATTFYGLNDAAWSKYKLGEFLETDDPTTGKPAVANPWRAAPVILGMTLPMA